MGWAAGAWATGAWRGTAWAVQDATVTVPDVVGETQAAGTATLEGAGFVVAVNTAHSSIVPAGTIISQVPTGGVEANSGSTVTITVSLGDAPPAEERNAGGWPILWETFSRDRERARRKRLRDREEAERIQEELDRAIALEQRRLEAEQAEAADLDRLRTLVARFADEKAEEAFTERVRTAYLRAAAQQNASALLAFEREMSRMFEEEEFAVLIALLNDE